MESSATGRTPQQTSTGIVARRWPRYPVDLPLRVRVATLAGHEFMLGHGRDVSQGGMALYVPAELEVGYTVVLELILTGSKKPLTLRAQIKNRTGFRYGVEFLDPTPEQQEIILTCLQKLLDIETPGNR